MEFAFFLKNLIVCLLVSCIAKEILLNSSKNKGLGKFTQQEFKKRVEKILSLPSPKSSGQRTEKSLRHGTASKQQASLVDEKLLKSEYKFDDEELGTFRLKAMDKQLALTRERLSQQRESSRPVVSLADQVVKEQLLKSAYRKAEDLYQLQQYRALRKSYCAWFSYMLDLKGRQKKLEWKRDFKSKAASWKLWLDSVNMERAHRARIVYFDSLKQERKQDYLAECHDRKQTLWKFLHKLRVHYKKRTTMKQVKGIEYQRTKDIDKLLMELQNMQLGDNKKKSSEVSESDQMSNARKPANPKARKVMPDSKLLSQMQEREKSREERKKAALERKVEQTRQMQLKKLAEEKVKIEIEERKRREFLEEKKKNEEEDKLKQQQKEAQLKLYRENLIVAKNHYERTGLLYFRGVSKWRKVLKNTYNKEDKSKNAEKIFALKSAYGCWSRNLTRRQERRELVAKTTCESKLMKGIWSKMKQYSAPGIARKRKMNAECKMFQLNAIFKTRWHSHFEKQKSFRIKKEETFNKKADCFFRTVWQKRMLKMWIVSKKNNQERKWREFRRNTLRQRAQELLIQSPLQGRMDKMEE